ncbi:hypothetical protein EU244_033900 [Rhodococcus qingshengii]|uniref:hypothetical protein n=1 Tax=Rhodococcus qingshengii TaxID=334542 RepID=UPI0010A5E314|nr:hypothetical protein [Rhodococcus qingshengii]THJ69478.1 hypothetical protein EU244_21190 [Rhodococcus qingshengii]
MKPARKAADAAKPIKDFLNTILADREPGVRAALSLPPKWTPEVDGLAADPFVVVRDDTGPMEWPIYTVPQIGVTVWSNSRTRSRELAALCQGLLLAHRIPGITNVMAGSSILDDVDPDNHGRIAGFTVPVRIRTTPI